MEKKLKIVDIVMWIGFLFSIVLWVLVGKVNISYCVCEKVLVCVREFGVMDGMVFGCMLLNNFVIFVF